MSISPRDKKAAIEAIKKKKLEQYITSLEESFLRAEGAQVTFNKDLTFNDNIKAIERCQKLNTAFTNPNLDDNRLLTQYPNNETENISKAITYCLNGNEENLRQMLENGIINVNTVVPLDHNSIYKGYSLLHIAASKGHTNIVSLLLEKGAQIDLRNNKGKTPIDIAKQQEKTEVIAVLERQSNVLDLSRASQVTKQIISLVKKSDKSSLTKLAKIWEESKDTINITDPLHNSGRRKGWTFLHYAAAYGNVKFFKELVKIITRHATYKHIEADITPLYLAIENNKSDIVEQYVIDNGHNIDPYNIILYFIIEGDVVRLENCWNKYSDTTYLTPDANFVPDEVNNPQARYILSKFGDHGNWSLLHFAAAKGHYMVIQFLRSKGGIWTLLTNDGFNVVDIAIINNQRLCVGYLFHYSQPPDPMKIDSDHFLMYSHATNEIMEKADQLKMHQIVMSTAKEQSMLAFKNYYISLLRPKYIVSDWQSQATNYQENVTNEKIRAQEAEVWLDEVRAENAKEFYGDSDNAKLMRAKFIDEFEDVQRQISSDEKRVKILRDKMNKDEIMKKDDIRLQPKISKQHLESMNLMPFKIWVDKARHKRGEEPQDVYVDYKAEISNALTHAELKVKETANALVQAEKTMKIAKHGVEYFNEEEHERKAMEVVISSLIYVEEQFRDVGTVSTESMMRNKPDLSVVRSKIAALKVEKMSVEFMTNIKDADVDVEEAIAKLKVSVLIRVKALASIVITDTKKTLEEVKELVDKLLEEEGVTFENHYGFNLWKALEQWRGEVDLNSINQELVNKIVEAHIERANTKLRDAVVFSKTEIDLGGGYNNSIKKLKVNSIKKLKVKKVATKRPHHKSRKHKSRKLRGKLYRHNSTTKNKKHYSLFNRSLKNKNMY